MSLQWETLDGGAPPNWKHLPSVVVANEIIKRNFRQAFEFIGNTPKIVANNWIIANHNKYDLDIERKFDPKLHNEFSFSNFESNSEYDVVASYDKGFIVHTNHFIYDEIIKETNGKIYPSSIERYNTLLSNAKKLIFSNKTNIHDLTVDDFK